MTCNVYFWRGETTEMVKVGLGCEVIWAEGQDCKVEAFKMLKTDDYTFTKEDFNTFKMERFNMTNFSIEEAAEGCRNGSTDIFLKKDMPKNTEWKIRKIDFSDPDPKCIFGNKEFFCKIADATKCEELKKWLNETNKILDCIHREKLRT